MESVAKPLRIEHWDEHRLVWVGDHATDAAAAQSAARVRRRLTDVRWIVAVEPAGVFQWKNVRKEVERRARHILKERQRGLDVPAIDEADALRLAGELEKLDCVRSTSARRLGWFERWRRREQLFGNYASDWGAGSGGALERTVILMPR